MAVGEALPVYAMPIAGFDHLKAIHAAAYLLGRSGGHLEKLKLIKLLYLAEREHFGRYEEPLFWDELYSLPHGPICSATLNCIDMVIYRSDAENYIFLSGNRNVHRVRGVCDNALDHLSDVDRAVLDDVWQEHGSKTASQLRNFTHQHCAEYTETDRSRVAISYESILSATGSSMATEVESEISAFRCVVARYQ